MSVLIALAGKKQSGKGTVAGFIKEWASDRGLTAEERGFADKLKLSAARAFGLDTDDFESVIKWADWLKSKGSVITVRAAIIPGDSYHETTISGRAFLQCYGTEAHRDLFGQDFWAEQLLPHGPSFDEVADAASPIVGDGVVLPPNWTKNFDHADICIISDLRFDNEARRVIEVGGQIWVVLRPDLEDDGDQHSSEKPLTEPVHGFIMNDSDLNALRSRVRRDMDSYWETHGGN